MPREPFPRCPAPLPPFERDDFTGVAPVPTGVVAVRPSKGRIRGTEARITARQGSMPLKMLARGIVAVMSLKFIVERTRMRRAEITHVL